MHLLLSLLPLIAFWAVESRAGLGAAVAASLVAALPGLGWAAWTRHRVDRMALGALGLAAGLGGLAWLSDDPRFVLWTPVIGNVAIGGLLAVATLRGAEPVAAALREADPTADLDDDDIRWLRGVGWRFCAALLVHGAASAWATTASRETWLAVTGVGGWVVLGVWAGVEALLARTGRA